MEPAGGDRLKLVSKTGNLPAGPATVSSAVDSSLPSVALLASHWDGPADDLWLPEMAWAVPKYAKKRVNWAGAMLLPEAPNFGDGDEPSDEYQAWVQDYFLALDIVNNWRSSHNFPLNTFHIGLKKRAKQIDPKAITAQRIKRLASIEAKLSRFPTMTLSQMQTSVGVGPSSRPHSMFLGYAKATMIAV